MVRHPFAILGCSDGSHSNSDVYQNNVRKLNNEQRRQLDTCSTSL